MSRRHLSLRRTHNFQVLHPATGQVVRTHFTTPDAWKNWDYRQGSAAGYAKRPRSLTGFACAILGSDDVAVLCYRDGGDDNDPDVCRQVVQRMNCRGEILWERHWNTPNGAHNPLTAPSGLISAPLSDLYDRQGIAPLASGDIVVLGGDTAVALDKDDGTTLWTVNNAGNQSLLPIPGTNKVRYSGDGPSTDYSASGRDTYGGNGALLGTQPQTGGLVSTHPMVVTPGYASLLTHFGGYGGTALCVTASNRTVTAETWSPLTYQWWIDQPDLSPLSGLVYSGVWNPSLNSPMLTPSGPDVTKYYSINSSGTQNLGGARQVWSGGSYIFFGGGEWKQINWQDAITAYHFASRAGLVIRNPSSIGWDEAAGEGPADDDGYYSLHMPYAETFTPPASPEALPWTWLGDFGGINPADPAFRALAATISGDRLYVMCRDAALTNYRLRCYDFTGEMLNSVLWEFPCFGGWSLQSDSTGVYVLGSGSVNGNTCAVWKLDPDGNPLWGQYFQPLQNPASIYLSGGAYWIALHAGLLYVCRGEGNT